MLLGRDLNDRPNRFESLDAWSVTSESHDLSQWSATTLLLELG